VKAWLVTIAVALAVASAGVRCGAEVPLGVDPASDAAAGRDDGGADGDGG
jgi:hypothetical protein